MKIVVVALCAISLAYLPWATLTPTGYGTGGGQEIMAAVAPAVLSADDIAKLKTMATLKVMAGQCPHLPVKAERVKKLIDDRQLGDRSLSHAIFAQQIIREIALATAGSDSYCGRALDRVPPADRLLYVDGT